MENFLQKTKFKYCPKCSSKNIAGNVNNMVCSDCGYKLYFNCAAATSNILINQNRILVIKRKFNPGKGMYDLPGGFVDYGETLEQGAKRELLEEINYAPPALTYFTSHPNTYLYKDVKYHTMDCAFYAEIPDDAKLTAGDDADSLFWLDIKDVDISLFAFESIKNVLADFIKLYNSKSI